MKREVYCLCFMCSVRCPIKVTVEDDKTRFIEGNPHVSGMEGSICPRGVSGAFLADDQERLRHPMIRTGPRGSGQWRRASWDEALDTIAERLQKIIVRDGARTIAFGERAQVSTHINQAFMSSIGSPNHFTHDTLCRGSNRTATNSLFGCTVTDLSPDYKNSRHVVLYGHNLFEAINVRGVRHLIEAMGKGARLTYIDPRVTVTATKAHRYFQIRPGTDLALNYALIHVLVAETLYDAAYVERWVDGFEDLKRFIAPCTPKWAAEETGIPADQIRDLARELARDAPAVLFHFGHRAASYTNEVYLRRSIGILNALTGSIEAPGGYILKKNPTEAGGRPARKLTDQTLPEVDEPRFDKVGTPAYPLPERRFGVAQAFPGAVLDQDPYPIHALLLHRFEPIMSIPDSAMMKRAIDRLELIVTMEINWSATAWRSDIVLPEPSYLERTDPIQQANGARPAMFLSQQAISPRGEGRESAVVIRQLAERLDVAQWFPYTTMEELVAWQLEGTGFVPEDFREKGFVQYGDRPILYDRTDGIRFKTPSGKIEFDSSMFRKAGIDPFPPYEPAASPPEGAFRLTVGRCAQHTHISTQNNPYLNELVAENVLWVNAGRAATLGIKDGNWVEVASSRGSGRIRAYVTDLIHPEAVFMLHGFGHEVEKSTRSFRKGLADGLLMENISDPVGGSPALHHTFVTVSPV